MEISDTQANRIVSSIKRVLETGDIEKLTKAAYHFITGYMGFIAHYDLYGFCGTYADVGLFAHQLQTSEYSDDRQHALQWADELEKRAALPESNWDSRGTKGKDKADVIRRVVALAAEHEPRLVQEFAARKREQEIAYAHALLAKHGTS